MENILKVIHFIVGVPASLVPKRLYLFAISSVLCRCWGRSERYFLIVPFMENTCSLFSDVLFMPCATRILLRKLIYRLGIWFVIFLTVVNVSRLYNETGTAVVLQHLLLVLLFNALYMTSYII